MPMGIDPREWLDDHDPGVPAFRAFDAGKMVLDSHKGNVWVALYATPELRIETALAWLAEEAQSGDCSRVVRCIEQLGSFIDAEDGVSGEDL